MKLLHLGGDVSSLRSSQPASGGVRLAVITRPRVAAPHLPKVATAHNQPIPVPSPFAQASVPTTLTLHKQRTRNNCETGSPIDRPPPANKLSCSYSWVQNSFLVNDRIERSMGLILHDYDFLPLIFHGRFNGRSRKRLNGAAVVSASASATAAGINVTMENARDSEAGSYNQVRFYLDHNDLTPRLWLLNECLRGRPIEDWELSPPVARDLPVKTAAVVNQPQGHSIDADEEFDYSYVDSMCALLLRPLSFHSFSFPCMFFLQPKSHNVFTRPSDLFGNCMETRHSASSNCCADLCEACKCSNCCCCEHCNCLRACGMCCDPCHSCRHCCDCSLNCVCDCRECDCNTCDCGCECGDCECDGNGGDCDGDCD